MQQFLENGSPHRALRRDVALNHTHWATTRRAAPDTIFALAIDHRSQLEALADDAGADPARIAAFKTLAVQAAVRVAGGKPGFGMLLDGTHGREALFRAADHDLWVARPVEKPGSRPLDFDVTDSLGAHLIEWPVWQVVKCLCFYHPDDPAELRARQDRELLRLFDATRTIGRELLIEIIAGKHGELHDDTVARVVTHLYSLGIKPDWWKLETQPSAAAWTAIGDAIRAGDPFCRGVVMLGLDAPMSDLAAAFATSRAEPLVRGFAVGRTIFAEPAAAWLAGRIDDAAAVDEMAATICRSGSRMAGSTRMTIRLTMAQALVRALSVQMTVIGGERVQLFGGVWAIFGHGNVAGMGEALHEMRDTLPTYRAHNEQGMAFAAVAYAKAARRRRMMAVTTSIGPGATNLVTPAALAHVNRLPVLLLPGDVFAGRGPDPVLQQVESFGDGTVSANDCLRPVSRYFDRLTRPEQLVPAFYRAMETLTDPVTSGPVTLALCQDVQAEAWDYPEHLFEERVWTMRRPAPDPVELAAAVELIRAARKPLIVCGGGVLYSEAERELLAFCEAHGIPSCETQAGKSALPEASPLNMGAVGVTGTAAANALAEEADLVLAVGTRLADFTTGSWALFRDPSRRIVGLNVAPFDAGKHRAQPLVADVRSGLAALTVRTGGMVGTERMDRSRRVRAGDMARHRIALHRRR